MHASVWLAIINSSLVGMIHTDTGLSGRSISARPRRGRWRAGTAI